MNVEVLMIMCHVVGLMVGAYCGYTIGYRRGGSTKNT